MFGSKKYLFLALGRWNWFDTLFIFMIRIVWINTLSLATKAFVLQSVLVRGSVSEGTVETGLRKTMLDIGVPQMTGGPLVEEAEECRCPPGYSGFSCESCSIGFYRNSINNNNEHSNNKSAQLFPPSSCQIINFNTQT